MPRPPSAWLERAQKLREELRHAAFGDKAGIFQAHSQKTGYTVQTLKKEVTGADFVARMEWTNPGLANNLKKLGVAAVVELARLYRDDEEAAVRLGQEIAEGKRPWREAKVHRKPTRFSEANSRRAFLLGALQSYIEVEEKLVLGDPVLPNVPLASATYELHDGRLLGVAALLVGEVSTYDRLAPYLALLAFYDRVFLAIDREEVPLEWRDVLHFMIKPARFSIFCAGNYEPGERAS